MRKVIVIMLAVIALLTLTACRKEPVAETPNVRIPSILYNGNIYCTTGKQIPAEVDESAIAGYVNSVVPLTQMPTEEGQANFEILYAPYAMTSEGLLVLVDGEWTLFEMLDTDAAQVTETIPETTVSQTQPTVIEQWYSQEQAMIAGFVVTQDGDVRHNQTEWMRYMAAVEKKEPASVTVMKYIRTEEGSQQSRFDLSYDGVAHHLTCTENGEKTEKTYTQLLKQQEALDDSREPYDSVIRYLLADGDMSEVLFEDLIAETDFDGVTEIAFHLKEGDPALKVYSDAQTVNAIISLLKHGEYLSGDPEEYYYGAKLLMQNGKGEQLVLELDLNQGNYRYGMQTYCYGQVSDLLSLLGLEKWPEEVYAEHGNYMDQ